MTVFHCPSCRKSRLEQWFNTNEIFCLNCFAIFNLVEKTNGAPPATFNVQPLGEEREMALLEEIDRDARTMREGGVL